MKDSSILQKKFYSLSIKEYLTIVLVSILPIFFVYIPFITGMTDFLFLQIKDPGFFNIIRNWDGPNYIVVGKTFYDTNEISKYLINDLPLEYYVAHLPLFPIAIGIFAPVFGWLYSGIIVNIVFGVCLNILFYFIAKKYTSRPLFLTFLFTVFPGRFLIVRSIIAPETMLVLFMLLSIYLWDIKKYATGAIAGSVAMLIKVQALFLFPAFLLPTLEDIFLKKKKITFEMKYVYACLIPGALLILCLFYYIRVGDFFAFLSAQEENSLFFTFPFAQFNYQNPWALTGWLEDVVFYILGMFILITSLYKSKRRTWFYFSLIYTLFLLFIPQRDITRFAFPLIPFFLLQFEKFLTSKTFEYAFYFSLPAIYFYTLNFILTNQAPIADWTPFLR